MLRVPNVPLSREAAPASLPVRPTTDAAYMRGGASPTFRGWHPAVRDASEEVKMSWDRATARAFDVIHNSGWISGSIDQAVANTVGMGLQLSAKPDPVALGMTASEASKWARKAEQRFWLWANNPYECDIEAKRTFSQIQAASFRSWFPTGETVTEFPWKRRPGGRYGTKVRMVPAHRLSQRSDYPTLDQGVRHDADGMPLSYLFRRKDPILGEHDVEIPARDRYGRIRVAHVFDGLPGQFRGITPLVPALQVARQFDQLSDAHLTAALIKAVFAATIVSDEPTEEVLKGLLTEREQAQMSSEGLTAFDVWQSMQEGWYKGTTIDVGIRGRFAHLFPGQKLEFQHAEGSAADFRDQAMFLLRELLRCLGLTYESGTGDYSGATYSSVRMSVGEIFQVTLYRRANLIAPICQAGYECWLEEEIARGDMEFPGGLDGFLEKKSAACIAEWRGTPKPQADDLKTAKAHETWRGLGVITDEMICNDLGVDVEDVYRQRQREAEMRKEYGLPEPGAIAKDPVADKLLAEKDA